MNSSANCYLFLLGCVLKALLMSLYKNISSVYNLIKTNGKSSSVASTKSWWTDAATSWWNGNPASASFYLACAISPEDMSVARSSYEKSSYF